MSSNRLNRKTISGMFANFSLLPQITDRTNEQFLEEILEIHKNQYTPINNIPTILGRKINLLKLYNAVAKQGGFKKMNTEWSWERVLADLKMPVKCANASVALRGIFQRYLEPFERLQRNKATINDIEEELQMESESRYKSCAQRTTLSHCNFNPISMVYRSDQHLVDGHKRQDCGLSCDLSEVVEFQKLEMSLRSGLINEIEFSLNTILLMSFQTDGVQLCRNNRLLDLILNMIGIGDKETLKDLCEHDLNIRRFIQFWNNNVLLGEGRRFLLPDVFTTDADEWPYLNRLNDMFKLDDELTIYDTESQRIQLVATIVRNLGIDTTNCRYLTQSHQCMRFIVLCCYSSHVALRHLGLEMMSTLSFPVVGIVAEIMEHMLVGLIDSEDRVDRLRGLELIAHISDQKVCNINTDFLGSLPEKLFKSLISMLIIHDLHVVVLALEALYGLSENSSYLCLKLLECSSETLPILLVLLSLEAQVMGPQSLIRIRVMQGPGLSTIQAPVNRLRNQPPHSSCKQLATSLMPPPPVPGQKVAVTTLPISVTYSTRPPVYVSTETIAVQSKPQVIQKMYPVVTVIENTHQNLVIPNRTPTTLKSELITTTSVKLLTSEKVSPGTTNGLTYDPNISLNLSTNHTSYTTLLPTANHKAPVISAVASTKPSQEIIVQTSNKTMTLENDTFDHVSNNVPYNNDSKSGPRTFTDKQEFVKKWLLSNYTESSQCTVPLVGMYKQLQVAVRKCFKDSEMVTAEEFHCLVRMLFSEVQLVQLQAADNNAEVHYYNLKQCPTVCSNGAVHFESDSSKCKQIISHSTHTNHPMNNAALLNFSQSNVAPISNTKDNPQNVQNILKRRTTEIVNSHSTEEHYHHKCPNKKSRNPDNGNLESSKHIFSETRNHFPIDGKSTFNSIYQNNGIVNPYIKDTEEKCNEESQFSERINQSYSNSQFHQVLNNTAVEELKHSDSETKDFSSSTVSPIHCDSLVNGTDGSSDSTMDSELGRIICANIPIKEPEKAPQFPSNVLNCSTTVLQETNINMVPTVTTNSSDNNTNKRNTKKNNYNQLGKTRSRFRNNNATSKGKQRVLDSQKPFNLAYLYICEWDNCMQCFDRPQKVYGHVYTNHFMTLRTELESKCYWSGCNDITPRTPLPLLNHVNEQHCNNIALESARQIRLAKENEKSSSNTISNNAVKTEPEITSRLLNFCPTQNSNIKNQTIPPIPKTSNPSLLPTSDTSSAPVTLLSSCVSMPTAISSVTHTSSSLPSQSFDKPLNACLQPSPTTVSKDQQFVKISSPTITQSIGSSSSDIALSRCSDTTSAIANTQSTCNPQITSIVNSTITRSTLPMPKHSKPEGPVTKHIRFLAALILRNLCRFSTDARRFVAARHQQIFEMSISGCESSRALCECLFYSTADNTGNIR